MGCFSFLCKACGKSIKSNSFRGEPVTLYLLKDGKVLQSMEGEYDSYGRVFGEKWAMPWGEVCDLMFSEDRRDGIAAIHVKCRQALPPLTQSERDPNQGWGEDGELFASVDESDEWEKTL